jgi:serine/threonine protein kinase
MEIIWAGCRNPIELTALGRDAEIVCPACGSSFRFEGDSTIDWKPHGDQKVGRFRLLRFVGQGAFGVVYQARDTELDRTVAVKVPRLPQAGGSPDHERFLREARSVAQLRHPSIVSVHEVGQHEGTPYLVTDFIVGVTLADLLTTRRPGFRESAELTAAVAEALHYAH